DIGPSIAVQFVAGQAQLTVPGRLRRGVQCTMPQPRVSLPQGLLQPLPGWQEAMFHVEHAPVEELPANLGRTFQQAKAVRIDDLKRQYLGELGGASSVLPVDANLQLALAIAGNPQVAVQ